MRARQSESRCCLSTPPWRSTRSWRCALADDKASDAREARRALLIAQPFAHRGLHGAGVPENSLPAIRAAIADGHGIEIDVQLSRDDVAFVIHDADTARMTGAPGRVRDLPATAVDALRLAGTTEVLPRLVAVLAAINGRVPLLIEAKARSHPVAPLCLAIRRAIEGYPGPVAVMSFNPQVGHWFATHAPRVLRGLVVTEKGRERLRSRLGGRIARGLAIWRARPDFLAYDINDLPSRLAARQRKRGLPILTWTVRSADAEACAMIHADQIIYEQA